VDIETFLLERNQTLYENDVEFNLTESGVHPCSMREILTEEEISSLANLPLGYAYTDGRPALRAAIAGWYCDASAENVAVTHGASEANLLCALSVLSPGDEIIVVLPNFMQLPGLLRALNVRVVTYTLEESNDWQPDPAALRALVGERTRMIALANPNNPTGQVLSSQSMRAVAQIVDTYGLYLLADEIYRGAEIDRPETPSFYGFTDRVVVTSSLSKAFALPGLRLGWVVGPAPLVGEIKRRQDYTSIGTGLLSQCIAERALEANTRHKILERTRLILSRNVRVLDAWLVDNAATMSCRRPQAGAIAFLRYSYQLSSEEFSTRLREQQSVFVVAGSWFGIDQHVRLGIGGEVESLRTALQRIDRFTASLP
jgi:aspartate/methionine/tyrosine aminotransferase